jgi:hypothetical protein
MTLFFIIMLFLVLPLSVPLVLEYKRNPQENTITRCMKEAETLPILVKISTYVPVHPFVVLLVGSAVILLALSLMVDRSIFH